MTDRARMASVIRDYYDGCNAADAAQMTACFERDAVHYFPAGAAQPTMVGAEAIARGWQLAVSTFGSCWTIDRLVLDEEADEATIEWTHFKPKLGAHLRGAELVRFGPSGLISEIRAYYAAPTVEPERSYELGDFDYAERGYPLRPPAVDRAPS